MINYSKRIEIANRYKELNGLRGLGNYSPYDVEPDWQLYMTPIEWSVFQDIRFLGLRFFPQYPIGKYFVDFADPVNKIVVEVDGREWHTDGNADKRRELEITKAGYFVYRISGSDASRYRVFCDNCHEHIKCCDCDDPYPVERYVSEDILRTIVRFNYDTSEI